MAITVDGYGAITQSNAREIYTAWKHGEIELNQAQQTKCQSFLSPQEMDDVDYDSTSSRKAGQDKISTTDENGNSTVDSKKDVSMAMGSIMAICGSIPAACAIAAICGFTSLAAAIASGVAAAAALGLSFAFDPSLDDRKNHAGNAENDNATMDSYTEALANTMDMMEEDIETYKAQQEELTGARNTQASDVANYQMDYDIAIAAGDTEGAKRAKENMKQVAGADYSDLEEGLEETGKALEEYSAMNEEAIGVSESGQTVADFLKDGKPLGKMALADAIIASVSVLAIAVATVVGAIPKIWAVCVPVDGPAAVASAVIWAAAGAMMGIVATKMFGKAKDESSCGDAGENMQTHVDSLVDMIGQQSEYAQATQEAFDESDEEAAESETEAQQNANQAVQTNNQKLANGGGDKDGDKDKTGSGSGAAA